MHGSDCVASQARLGVAYVASRPSLGMFGGVSQAWPGAEGGARMLFSRDCVGAACANVPAEAGGSGSGKWRTGRHDVRLFVSPLRSSGPNFTAYTSYRKRAVTGCSGVGRCLFFSPLLDDEADRRAATLWLRCRQDLLILVASHLRRGRVRPDAHTARVIQTGGVSRQWWRLGGVKKRPAQAAVSGGEIGRRDTALWWRFCWADPSVR